MDLLIAAVFEGGGDYLIKMLSLPPFFFQGCVIPAALGWPNLWDFYGSQGTGIVLLEMIFLIGFLCSGDTAR